MTKGSFIISTFLVFAIIGSGAIAFVLPGLAIKYFIVGNIKRGILFAVLALVIGPLVYQYLGRWAINKLVRRIDAKAKK